MGIAPPRTVCYHCKVQGLPNDGGSANTRLSPLFHGRRDVGNWIKSAIKHPGGLHRSLGVKQGEKIPAKKLAVAAKKGGKVGAQARLAKTLKGFHKNQFTGVVMNLVGAKVRYDKLEGIEYMVVPMVMITEGVHNGSGGPLYYPDDELGKTPASWDHKPIVVYHPEENGQGVSACQPHVLNTRKVGVILNTVYKGGRLKAEAWLNKERLKKVDNRVLVAIEKGEMVEISTGLYTDNEYVENGKWKDEKYDCVARNYRPDHLAILPDQVGSCSIKDGAGLLRNAHTHSHKRNLVEKAVQTAQGNRYAYVEDLTDTDRAIYHDKDGNLVHEGFKIDKKGLKATMRGDPQKITRKTQYVDPNGEVVANVDDEITDNVWTDSARVLAAARRHAQARNPAADAVRDATRAPAKLKDAKKDKKAKADQKPPPSKGMKSSKGPSVADAVFGGDGTTAESDHPADPGTKLKKSIPIKAGHGVQAKTTGKKGTTTMTKNEMIEHLIENSNGLWTEDQRDFLDTQDEDKLTDFVDATAPLEEETAEGDEIEENAESRVGGKVAGEEDGANTGIQSKSKKAKAAKKKISPEQGITGHAAKKPAKKADPAEPDEDDKMKKNQEKTTEEFLADAPAEIREMWEGNLRTNAVQKAKLVKTIMANKKNKFPVAVLNAKPLQELTAIAAFAAPEKAVSPIANYDGAGWGEGEPVNNTEETPMDLPSMGFGPKK